MELIKKTARKISTIFSIRDERVAFFLLRRGVSTLLAGDGDDGMAIGVELILSASAEVVGAATIEDDDDSISHTMQRTTGQ